MQLSRRLLLVLLVLGALQCGGNREGVVRTGARAPLRVLHVSPRGKVEGAAEIQVVFDRPIVPVGMREARPGTLQIQPRVPGTLHTVGTAAIIFVPDAPLPLATRFRVEVPEGVLANDNSTLPEAVRFTFETERPHVVEMIPARELEGLRQDQPFLFKFDQQVDAGELARRTRFTLGDQRVPATVVVDPADPSYLRVTPARALPLGGTVQLVIDEALVGTQGTLPMGQAVRRRFTVHGAPGLGSTTCVRERQANAGEPDHPCRQARLVLKTPIQREVIQRALRIDPPATVVYPEDQPRVASVVLSELRPSTRYRVTIPGGTTDIFGQTYSQDVTAELATPALGATIVPNFVGSVLAPGTPRTLSFEAVNVTRANLRIDRLEDPMRIVGLLRSVDPLPAQLAYASPAPMVFPAARNTPVQGVAQLEPLIGRDLGIYGYAVEESTTGVEPLLVTDLDVYARWSSRGGQAWVTSLATGAPVPRARVDIRDQSGRSLGQLETDARGLVALPSTAVQGEGRAERFLIVSRDRDQSFVQGRAQPSPSTNAASIVVDQRATSRGQTIHVKGLVARPPGSGPRAASGLALVRARGEGTSFGPVRARLSSLGSFEAALVVPDWAVPGPYELEARDPSGAWSATTSIEIRPEPGAAARVALQLGRDVYFRGQMAIWQVQASGVGAGGLAGAAVEHRAVGELMRFSPPGFETFAFGGVEPIAPGTVLLGEGAGVLGEDGSLAQSVRLAAPSSAPMRVRIEATVAGAGRASAETWAHPASFYTGLRIASVPDAAGNASLEVVAVDPAGQLVPRVSVRLEAIRQRFVNGEGGPRGVDEGRHERCRVTTADHPVSCRIRLGEAGVWLVTASASDARGNDATTQLYVAREGRVDLGEVVPPYAALLASSMPSAVGRPARLQLCSPFEEARALLLVGADGTLGAHVLTVPRGVTGFDLQVLEEMRPAVPVHLYLAGPRGQVLEASTRVFVSDTDRVLQVRVQPDAPRKAPGERLELRVQVGGADGRPVAGAEVTVAIVSDEGASLDPRALFAAPEPRELTRTSLRPSLVRPRARPRSTTASPAVPGLPPPLPELGHTVYWNGNVVTEPDGSALVRLTLPDRAASYRIVALAVAPGARGAWATSRIDTGGALRLEPRLVPELRVGDETSAVILVVNDTDDASEVDVVVESQKLLIRPPLTQHLSIPAGGTSEARFEVRAIRSGPAEIAIHGVAGAHRMEAVSRVDVGLGAEQEIRVRSGRLAGAATTVPLDIPGDATADVGGLSYTLSLDPAAAAISLARELATPTRDDAATLATALVARTFLARNGRRCGEEPPADNVDRAVELGRRLVERIDESGQARYFQAGPSEPELGAWIGLALGYARSAHLPLPRRRLATATFSTAQAPLFTWSRKMQGLPRAPIARAASGGPALVADAALRLLAGVRADRELFLGVLSSSMRPGAEGATIVPSLREQAHGISTVRATALGTLALYESRRDDVEADELVRGLLSLRVDGRYASPEEASLALMAFDASLARAPRDRAAAVATLVVDDSPVASAQLSRTAAPAATGEVPLSVVLGARSGALEIRRRGLSPVHYDLAVRFARLGPGDEPQEQGFAVERVYERSSETTPGTTPAMPDRTERVALLDTLVRVHIRIASGVERHNVVLDDILPAGCVRVLSPSGGVNPETASDATGPFAVVDSAPLDRAEFYAAVLPPGIHHISYLARAAFPGRYFAPGSELSMLTRPTVHGRAAGDVMVIEGR